MSHSVSHFEIPADAPEKLAAFYRELFGWQIDRVPGDAMEYWTIHTMPTDDKGMISEPGGINGGLRRRAAPAAAAELPHGRIGRRLPRQGAGARRPSHGG